MADEAKLEAVTGEGIVKKAIETAMQAAGKPYLWGGKTTAGFDCSGFVSYVFAQVYPNTATKLSMTAASFKSSDLFSDVADADVKPGDIVIFPASGGYPNHIGIVINSTSWIGSQSSTGVAEVQFANAWWSKRKKAFRRVKALSTTSFELGRGAYRASAVA